MSLTLYSSPGLYTRWRSQGGHSSLIHDAGLTVPPLSLGQVPKAGECRGNRILWGILAACSCPGIWVYGQACLTSRNAVWVTLRSWTIVLTGQGGLLWLSDREKPLNIRKFCEMILQCSFEVKTVDMLLGYHSQKWTSFHVCWLSNYCDYYIQTWVPVTFCFWQTACSNDKVL